MKTQFETCWTAGDCWLHNSVLQRQSLFPSLSLHVFTNVWFMSLGQIVEFWNWCWMLICLHIYFFVFWLIEKKDELLCKFSNEITQPFLYLERASKYISQQHKKHNNGNLSIISTFKALSKWHDPHLILVHLIVMDHKLIMAHLQE